jgi:S-DNA-T family DNA segregation ATPase FtsK/SpoIIIE
MARSSSVRTRSLTEEVADEMEAPEPVGLELAGVGLCLTGLLLATAIGTLAPEGASGVLTNAVGEVGRRIADAATRAVGLGVWVVPVFLVIWGVECLRGHSPRRFGWRALALPVMVGLTAVLGALLLKTHGVLPGLKRSGPGGVFGVAFGRSVHHALGGAAGLVVFLAWLFLLRFVADVRFTAARTWLLGLVTPRKDVEDDEAGGVAVAEAPTEEATEADDATEAASDDDEPDAEAEEATLEADEPEADGDEDEPARAPAKKAKPVRVAAIAAPPALPPEPKGPPPVRPPLPEDYVFPGLALLEQGRGCDPESVREEVEANATILRETLASFDVEAQVVSSLRGPVITFYEIAIPSGTRLNRVTALADDLAIALKAASIRIVAPIPGRNTVGIEVPNLQRDPVVMHDIVREASSLTERKAIPVFLGRDTAGRLICEDLATMPHLLIAGATGSGKSVCINSILLSVLYTRTPAEVRLILIDPKQVELSFFEGIPHLLTPVVTDMQRAAKILEWAVDRMEERYSMLLAAGVRNVAGYNALGKEKRAEIRQRANLSEEDLPDYMPYLVIVVDELADLMLTSGKEVELAITRLAQKSRAVGIHIILATQRPSTNVITGLIKANMPTRIAFRVASKIDSRVILDANGADKLLGMGDMLYMNPRTLHLRRAQGTLVTDAEARQVVDFLKEKCPPPAYQDILKQSTGVLGDPMEEDDLYNDAVRAVLATRLGSASMLQRRLGIGYTRASRLVDMMSDRGVVGPHVGSKAREVLYTLEEWDKAHGTAGAEIPGAAEAENPDERCVDESWD